MRDTGRLGRAGSGRMSAPGRVVLVGAGHAHLPLLRRGDEVRRAGHRLTVVEPSDFWYSGLATGVVGGRYPAGADRIDVGALAAEVGARLVRDRAVGLDRGGGVLLTASGERVEWDVLSFDVGSRVDPDGLAARAAPGAPPVVPVKPVRGLLDGLEALDGARGGRAPAVVVAGGGASGVEVAANLAVRHRGKEGARTVLVTPEARVLTRFSRGIARSATRALERRGVEVRTGEAVWEVGPGGALTPSGETIPCDAVVDATGLVPPPLVDALDLPAGPDGGIAVDRHLRSPADPRIFAAGDCAFFEPRPLPGVGVHAVRAAPVLLHNLLAALEGAPPRTFRPRGTVLLILNLGGGEALATFGPLHWKGRASFLLKDHLDRRFLERHRPG